MTKSKKVGGWIFLCGIGVCLGGIWLFASRGVWVRGARYHVLDGKLEGHDVREEVTIVHDKAGVPHIYGQREEDVFHALGYIMARDRFFQMDLIRRLGRGELAGLFGKGIQRQGMGLIRSDKIMRTFQYAARAKGAVSSLDLKHREILKAFTQGVNQYLKEAEGRIPEYKALRTAPEPWHVEDIFVCMDVYGLAMAGYSLFEEYFGGRLAQELSPDQASLFLLVRPEGTEELLRAFWEKSAGGKQMEGLSKSFLPFAPGLGSNNWVVSGEKTRSGMPIVSNDPHVPIAWVPTYWYHVHLSCPSYDSLGMVFPGTPFMGAGTNGKVAWGITNARCDMIDIFREKLHPEDSEKYFYNGQWRAFDTVRQQIPVKGGKPVPFIHRRSVHGAIIEEAMTGKTMFPPPGEVWSLHISDVEWRRFVAGYLAIPASTDASSFRKAISDMSMGPVAWNTVYATTEGDFGYLYAGHVAYRGDIPGHLPRPGTGEADWGDWIPFDELPHRENPEKGFFATSNNDIEPKGFRHYISSGYHKSSRVDRVTELLEDAKDLTVKDMLSIQLDVRVKSAERFVPLLLEDMRDATERSIVECRIALEAWRDGHYQASLASRGTGLYLMIMDALYRQTFEDELGPGLARKILPAELGRKAFWEILPKAGDTWFDDQRTNVVETRRDLVLEAARKVHRQLSQRYGSDPTDWEWGKLQTLHLFTPLGLLPWNKSYRVGSFPHGGTEETVNLAGGAYLDKQGYIVLGGPTTRMSVDMAEPTVFHFCSTTGNAEYPGSPFFRNTTEAWLQGQYLESRILPADRIHQPMSKLTLSR